MSEANRQLSTGFTGIGMGRTCPGGGIQSEANAAFSAGGVRKINQSVLAVPGVENYIEKPTLPSGRDLRQPGNRLGI